LNSTLRTVCSWPGPSYAETAAKGHKLGDEITREILDQLETSGWELYHDAGDPTEAHDLAGERPEKLRELVSLWWVEAGKCEVLPFVGSVMLRSTTERPHLTRARTSYVYYPDLSIVPIGSTPPVFNRPHSITAEVEIPDGGAEGVLLAQGRVAGGYVLAVKDGKLHYVRNYLGLDELRVTSSVDVPTSAATLRYEFEVTTPTDLGQGKGAGGNGQLYIDGELVGNAELPMTVPLLFGIEGLSCGYDFGEAVCDDYRAPFRFTGTIKQVTVDLSGALIKDDESTVRALMAQQ
jgi:arylsulfatase